MAILETSVRVAKGYTVISFSGAIDCRNIEEVTAHLLCAVAERPPHLVVDLSNLRSISVAALELLLRIKQVMSANDGDVTLVASDRSLLDNVDWALSRLPVVPALEVALGGDPPE